MTDWRTNETVLLTVTELSLVVPRGPLGHMQRVCARDGHVCAESPREYVGSKYFASCKPAEPRDADHMFFPVMTELASECDERNIVWMVSFLADGSMSIDILDTDKGTWKHFNHDPLIAACEALKWVTEQKENADG